MPGMPYHLEKGPWLSVLEDYLNADAARSLATLAKLRSGAPLAETGFLETGVLDDDPVYSTLERRVRHLNADWFGWQLADGAWSPPPTFAAWLWRALASAGPDPSADADLAAVRAADPELRSDASARSLLARAVDGRLDGIDWPVAGFWSQYYGDPEAIVRETLVRALEVSFGVDHDQEVPERPDRQLPLELFWKCPQRWFEGWVTWRLDPPTCTGQVTVIFATPGSGKPLIERPEDGTDPRLPTSTRTVRRDDAPVQPAAGNPDRAAEHAPKGMWVVSHRDHLLVPPVRSYEPAPLGEWRVPPFGPSYVGVGPVVVVEPSEADGGVRPYGRRYEPRPDAKAKAAAS